MTYPARQAAVGSEEPQVTVAARPRTQMRDEVVAHIQGLILSGQARPGSLLRLDPLAEALGLSVTPVREGLLLMAADGWIQSEPNRGFRVLPIARADVCDAYVVHAFVAGELAARATTRITDADLTRMRDIDAQIARAAAGHSSLEADLLNTKLHDIVDQAAGSKRLVWFRHAARRFVPLRSWGAIPGWLELNRTGHRTIIEAIAEGNADEARLCMTHHIEQAASLLVSYLDSLEFWTG